jgi:hypothetical protein
MPAPLSSSSDQGTVILSAAKDLHFLLAARNAQKKIDQFPRIDVWLKKSRSFAALRMTALFLKSQRCAIANIAEILSPSGRQNDG